MDMDGVTPNRLKGLMRGATRWGDRTEALGPSRYPIHALVLTLNSGTGVFFGRCIGEVGFDVLGSPRDSDG